MDCANGVSLFIQVHETCLVDFLKDFEKYDGGLKILAKEGDLYTIQVFIITPVEYPKCQKLEDSGNE